MPINNTQLQTWANAPSSSKIQNTYQAIKNALNANVALQSRNYEVYLQGSYANSTNIRAESDVDIVVQLNSTFGHNISSLSLEEQRIFHETFPAATYFWADFRRDVLAALVDYFGQSSIKERTNCIKVLENESRVNADVLASLVHHEYSTFSPYNQSNFIEGIKFWTSTNTEIINYPKIHIDNGENKNASHRTNERYKDVVRIMKNIRRKMVDDNSFDPAKAPSYFVECAIYNVPDGHFIGDHQTSVGYALDYLRRTCDAPSLRTVSHQHSLFGSEPWQWDISDAGIFLENAESYYLSN